MHRLIPILATCMLAACGARPPQGQTPYTVSPAMLDVLKERQDMHARDLDGLSPFAAREVPNLQDASRAIPNVKGLPAPDINVPQVSQLIATGAEGGLPARLYRPALAKNTPVIIYFTGGTWVTGSVDAYDDSARQLAIRTGWVVVSIRPRQAPEARFPAIHEDAFEAYRWARSHLRDWGGDPTRVVLAGEGPGANLALSTALRAREEVARGTSAIPDHLLLITPVAGTALNTPSMRENARSEPLTRAIADWSQYSYARGKLSDPRINLVDRPDLAGLPPTTIVLAESDPLRSGGEELANRLAAAGVPAQARIFPGTTYDFFGLGDRVPEAAAAEDYAATRLRAALDRPAMPAFTGAPAPARRR